MVSVVILLSTLLSVAPATASEASDSLKEFAYDYLHTSKGMFGQGHFTGLVKGRAASAIICLEPGTKNGQVYTAVANVILTDKLVNKIEADWQIVDYALLKSFPCVNL